MCLHCIQGHYQFPELAGTYPNITTKKSIKKAQSLSDDSSSIYFKACSILLKFAYIFLTGELFCIVACVLLQTWSSLMNSDGVANQVYLISSAGF